MTKLQKVEVTWKDSNFRSGWASLEQYTEEGKETSLQCRTVGYLVVDEDDRIGVVNSLAWIGYPAPEEPRDGDGMMVIPRSAVVKIKKLK